MREFYLNKLLTAAWDEFSRSLETGQTLTIESHVSDWVKDAMAEALAPAVEALDVSKMPDASSD